MRYKTQWDSFRPVTRRCGQVFSCRGGTEGHRHAVERHEDPRELNQVRNTLTASAKSLSDHVGKSYSASELESVAAMLTKLKVGEDVRREKVADIRGRMGADCYDESAKLDLAIDGLLDDLNL